MDKKMPARPKGAHAKPYGVLPIPQWLPRNALLFSFVSFLNDVSSEMIFPILPIFLTLVLGAPVQVLGLIEGGAHAVETLLRGASGYYSDSRQSRRPLIIAGYGISAIAKPIFALSLAWPFAMLVRVADRAGKGIRVTARDAMLAEDSRGPRMGEIFGIRKMADSAGAVLGPLVTFALLGIAASWAVPIPETYRIIFLLSFIPAALGVFMLYGVQERKRDGAREPVRKLLAETLFPPPGAWRNFLVITAVFALGNFSYAFFILASSDAGISAANIVLLYVLFNIFYMLFAVPAGMLTDKWGAKAMLCLTFAFFALVCAVFGIAGSFGANAIYAAAAGFVLYGIFCAAFETVARIYVAEHFQDKRLGSGLGAYNLVIGVMALPSGILAGILYAVPGPFGINGAMWLGIACSLAAAIGVSLFWLHSVHVADE